MTIGCSVLPSALRARIDGAVIRLPGTGDGVARLVEVSMVNVDMAAPLAPLLRCGKNRQRSQPRWREWRANQKIVQTMATTTMATSNLTLINKSPRWGGRKKPPQHTHTPPPH